MSNVVTRTVVGRKTKWAVLVFWLILFAVLGSFSSKLTDAQKNDASSWLPGSAESTQVIQQQDAFQGPNTFPAVIVYERAGGLTAADKAKVTADAKKFTVVGSIDGQITGPTFADGAAEVQVPFDLGHNGWNKAPGISDAIHRIADGDPGLTVHVTGPLGFAADSADSFAGLDGTLLFAALAVVVVMLLLTYRSPTLWLLPVLSAVFALTVSLGVIYLLAKHAGLTVNGQSQGIVTVLVFGAGTDYALLIVARYREELRRHEDRHEAMALALHRAGPAIVASAGTVILGMLCLLIAEMNSTSSLGPVCAIGVGVALLSMTTLLPALLVIFGRWVFWPRRPSYGSDEPTAHGMWARTGRRIAARPRTVWVGTSLALAAMALGLLGLHASGLTNKGSFRGTPESVSGEAVLAAHFPAGSGTPVVVVASSAHADAARTALSSVPGIVDVTQPIVKGGTAYLQGTMQAAPDSQAGYDTIDRARAIVHQVGPDALVGGMTAVNLDVKRASTHDRNVIIPVVLLVVFLVLALLLRAVLAPVLLVATVVLSFAAALGISALFFDHVFNFEGSDTSFPLFVFVFLVALGIDYNIFLMSRIREETLKHGTRAGALTGLAATGGVITSAGLVLAGTFAVLATLPLTFTTELGFAVALGVLLDTFVVRSILVTSLALDVGDRIWWPSKLAKRIWPGDDAGSLPGQRGEHTDDPVPVV
jgi:RND superfamily putative drug exporter